MNPVLITGSRGYTARSLMSDVLDKLDRSTLLIHGGAKGADKLCTSLAMELGFPRPHVVRPDYEYWVNQIGRPAGYRVAPTKRNELMLDGKISEDSDISPELIPQLVLAFFVEPVETGGTARCVEQARLRQIPVLRFSSSEPF